MGKGFEQIGFFPDHVPRRIQIAPSAGVSESFEGRRLRVRAQLGVGTGA